MTLFLANRKYMHFIQTLRLDIFFYKGKLHNSSGSLEHLFKACHKIQHMQYFHDTLQRINVLRHLILSSIVFLDAT